MAYTTIDDPSAYFQTALWTGNGSTQSIVNDGNSDLQPDWIWTKKRNSGQNHHAIDSTRGASKAMVLNDVDGEATKSNGISITMPFWDERFEVIKKSYPEIKTDQFHIDILTARFVLTPEWFDVVVASNLFGDILSDLGPACAGTIGIAPSGNINPSNKFPSLFEPVHGSAPDIAGKGSANPIGQIWSGAMMLEHLGETDAAKTIINSIEKTLSIKENRTIDLQGNSNTVQCTKAILDNIK